MQEIWKDIPGYEGFYQARTLGRIRSVSREVPHSSGKGKCFRTGKVLSPAVWEGYQSVSFSINGKHSTPAVHRLIAITFLPNPDNLPIVNHKDLDTQNNCVDNLEWATQQYNCIHAIEHGHSPKLSPLARTKAAQAAKEANSKKVICLTTDQLFDSVKQASEHFHITMDTVIRSAKLQVLTRSGLEFRYIKEDDKNEV